jgi:hypothetical protein
MKEVQRKAMRAMLQTLENDSFEIAKPYLLSLLDDADRCAELEQAAKMALEYCGEGGEHDIERILKTALGEMTQVRVELKGIPDHFKRIAELEAEITAVCAVLERAAENIRNPAQWSDMPKVTAGPLALYALEYIDAQTKRLRALLEGGE